MKSELGAIEAQRFQTRHLVSSFDNHAMNPGVAAVLIELMPDGVMEAGADPYGCRFARAW
jgi:gamma-glutamyltranspeptidase / glutathione hydrolase